MGAWHSMCSQDVPSGDGGCQRKAFSKEQSAVAMVTTPQGGMTGGSGGRTSAQRRRQIPTVAMLPATPIATVSSGKSHRNRSTLMSDSARSRALARKNIKAATAQGQPANKPKARETTGIR